MLTNLGRFGPKATVLGLQDAAKPIAVWNIIKQGAMNC